MSVFYANKRQKKIPTAVFSLKNENEIIVKLKKWFETLPFELIKRNTYLVQMADIDKAVKLCLEMGLYIECIPEQVEKALGLKAKAAFDETFRERAIYKTLFPYQKEGIERVVRDFDGRCLIADDMGLGKTLQVVSLFATLTVDLDGCELRFRRLSVSPAAGGELLDLALDVRVRSFPSLKINF